MVLRGVHIALLIYFIVTGVLALVGLLRPDLLVVGILYGAVLGGPVGAFLGMLVAAAPILFLYPLLFIVVWALARPLGRVVAVVVALVVTAGVGAAIPLYANQSTWQTVDALRADDRSVAQPVTVSGIIALLDDTKLFGKQTGPECEDLCLRLLFNGAVRRVITGIVKSGDQDPLTARNVQAFSIERRSTCQAPSISIRFNWPDEKRNPREVSEPSVNRFLARIAAGECLVQTPARIEEADMILVEAPIKQAEDSFRTPWRLRLDTVAARRLTLLQRSEKGLVEIDRLTQVTAKPLMVPLLVGMIGRSGLDATSGFVRKEVRNNVYDWRTPSAIVDQYRRLFGDAVRLPDVVPGADPVEGPSVEQLRGLVAKALDDPNAEPAGFSVFGSYMHSLAEEKRLAPEDLALLTRAIADPRFRKFQELANGMWKIGRDAGVLAAPLANRLTTDQLPRRGEGTVAGVAYAIFALPPGAASPIAPQLARVLQEKEKRGYAWRAIARIGDGGSDYVSQYVAVLESRPRSETTASKDGNVLIGVLMGLCRLGESAEAARGPLVAYLREQHAMRRTGAITDLAAEAAFRAGAEKEVEAVYGSDTKEWRFIQRRWQKRERGTPQQCRY